MMATKCGCYLILFSFAVSLFPAPSNGQHEGHQMPPAKKAPSKTPAKGKADQKAMPMEHQGHQMPGKPGEMQPGMKMDGMEMMAHFAGIPHMREGSGTSWQPDSTPLQAQHQMKGLWQIMQHYNGFLSYDHQGGRRGNDQVNGIGCYMLMASRPMGKGELMLRTMLSPEPLTVGKHGYPLLFQTGESVHGRPLVDSQHPHDLFMELAARYRHEIGNKTAAFLYVAPSGEPVWRASRL